MGSDFTNVFGYMASTISQEDDITAVSKLIIHYFLYFLNVLSVNILIFEKIAVINKLSFFCVVVYDNYCQFNKIKSLNLCHSVNFVSTIQEKKLLSY